MKIEAITPGFAADLSGVDVRRLSEGDFEVMYDAWLRYGVLRLRGQGLEESDLETFSARFGPLEEVPLGRLSDAQRAKVKNRFVTQISNIVVNGKPIGGLGNAEASWHSDMTYVPTPPPASVLLGVEIPPAGGIPTSLIRRRPSRLCRPRFGPASRPSRLSMMRPIPA